MFDPNKQNPWDGYRADFDDVGSAYVVTFGMKLDNEFNLPVEMIPEFKDHPGVNSVEVGRWEADSMEMHGHAKRVHILSEAIASYLNTGGDWRELKNVITTIENYSTQSLEIPGYFFYETMIDREGFFCHSYLSTDQTSAFVWIVDSHFDPLTIAEWKERRDQEEADVFNGEDDADDEDADDDDEWLDEDERKEE